MSILSLRILPDPILRRKARKVGGIDASIHKLAEDMIETMRYHHGVGLAANQVGILKRVISIEMPDEPVRILINPTIIKRQGEREVEEGCLSVPGYKGLITRAIWVRAKSLDLGGREVRIKADGLLAQALEHEIDHLNGIIYIDHLKKHEDIWKLESPDEHLGQIETSHHQDLRTGDPEEAPVI